MRNKTFLAIVPARKGSKRLPNKNIKELNNKPLIAYTIEASLKCKYITKTVVSTDCENAMQEMFGPECLMISSILSLCLVLECNFKTVAPLRLAH